MAGGVTPERVLGHRLCAHHPLSLLVAPPTARVSDEGAIWHAPILLPPHRWEQAMTRAQRDRTAPLGLGPRPQALGALVAGWLGWGRRVAAGLIGDARSVLRPGGRHR